MLVAIEQEKLEALFRECEALQERLEGADLELGNCAPSEGWEDRFKAWLGQ